MVCYDIKNLNLRFFWKKNLKNLMLSNFKLGIANFGIG